MKTAYFDCFSGASGDMIVAALLDAGMDIDLLRSQLAKLKLAGYQISATKVHRGPITATKFTVELDNSHQPTRNLEEIEKILNDSDLAPKIIEKARAIFQRLAQAEAKVHGIDIKEIHFHEVGAIDSIVDIVSAVIAITAMQIEQVLSSPIAIGTGTVQTHHGTLPIPAPATVELLRGFPTRQPVGTTEETGELTTPTGAAIITSLSKGYEPIPEMKLQAIGYGAGSREESTAGGLPNVLRVIIGETQQAASADSVVELSANIDDCTGEIIGSTIEKLLSAGCLDAWVTPIYMKKSRPAWMLCALCPMGEEQKISRIIFTETTTLGVRIKTVARAKLPRRYVIVETKYGPIRIKVAEINGEEISVKPEFTDCTAAAQAHGVAVKEVITQAMRSYGNEIAGNKDRGEEI